MLNGSRENVPSPTLDVLPESELTVAELDAAAVAPSAAVSPSANKRASGRRLKIAIVSSTRPDRATKILMVLSRIGQSEAVSPASRVEGRRQQRLQQYLF